MPRDGSGTFTRTDGVRTGSTVWQQADAAAVNIEAPDHDTHDEDIGQALTDSLAKDGQTVATGDLQMGNNEITGMADGSANTSAATVRQIQNQSGTYGTDTGVANAYNVSVSPSLGAYATGVVIRFEPANTNTGASTIQVSGLAVRNILSADGKTMVGGELVAGRQVELVDDGTAFRLQGVQSSVVLVDADPGADVSPTVDLKRDSASPAASDQIGAVRFYGRDSGGNETLYGEIAGQISDAGDGAEDGALRFEVADNGTFGALRMLVSNSEVQITDSDTGAAFGPQLALRRASSSPSDGDDGGYIDNAMNNSALSRTSFSQIVGEAVDVTAGTEDGGWRFMTMQSGTLTQILRLFGDTFQVDGKMSFSGQSDFQGQQTVEGETICRRDGANPLRVDRLNSDGFLVLFDRGGSTKGDISVSGEVVSYNGYLNSHFSQWGTGLDPIDPIVPRGTLLSTVDQLVTGADGEDDPNHVRVRITVERACRRIYGVFQEVREDGLVLVAAAGSGVARVQGPVKGGDLLMASEVPGVACVQDDDIWHAYTLGKASMGYDGADEALLPVALRAS